MSLAIHAGASARSGAVGRSPIHDVVRRHRRGLVHVLLVGGSPARRAALARAFHDDSPVRGGAFVHVSCDRDEHTLRRALLGWLLPELGANTENPLRPSERGTLFLDQIEELSLDTQRLLLEFLRAHEDGLPAWAGRLIAGSTVECAESPGSGERVLELLFDCVNKVRLVLGPETSEAWP